jgi:dihydroorotate dehydrogenase
MMFSLEAERAHEMGLAALRNGMASPFYVDDPSFGLEPIEAFGLKFANPIGIAAGFDKNAVAVDQLASLGFGFVEVGTVTAKPQPGNPKPRMFRLPDDSALINRLGFNNEGAASAAARIANLKRRCVIGVNIGKNKDVPNEEAVENYIEALDAVHEVADYVAVNISSPNTPGLRELQKGDDLVELLSALIWRNEQLGRRPLLVKIAPDLSNDEIFSIADVCLSAGIDGVIATNTTISRSGLSTANVEAIGAGGLSGRPLTHRSTDVVSKLYRRTKGDLPIIGVGGVFNAEDAFEKIAAGAVLVQAYTGFVYGGPTFAADVNRELALLLKERGFASIADAVGSAAA